MPFELPPKTCAEYILHLTFQQVNISQRLKGLVTYFDEQNCEIFTNFVINFLALNFLRFATIGSTSYEIILSSGVLDVSIQQQCKTSKPLNFISDMICKNSNFSSKFYFD